MLENFREWFAAMLPTIVESMAILFTLVILVSVLKRQRNQYHRNRWNEKLGDLNQWIHDTLDFYSSHYAYLVADAFEEEAVLRKLSRLAPVRQQAAVLCGRIGDQGLSQAMANFNLVEFQIFHLSCCNSSRAMEEYKGLLGQLRSAGGRVLDRLGLLRQ